MTRTGKGKRLLACICAAALSCAMIACTETGGGESPAGGSVASGSTETGSGGGPEAGSGTTAAEGESAGEEKDNGSGAALENGTVPYVDNDTVALGTLDAYDPAKSVEVNAGQAIEGNEEEELQQERIAGGAVGEVVSENLEPLRGITDPPEGDYTPVYGVDGQ